MIPKDRVVELRRVPASQLQPHPENWRRHPEEQVTALRGVLEQIGFADVALAVERGRGKNKRLVLVDGHARADVVDDDYEIPTLIVDLDDDEVRLLLATLDPLAKMADTDEASLAALLEQLEAENDDVASLLDTLAAELWPSNVFEPDDTGQYVRRVDAPVYEPTGPAPPLATLADRTVADRLRDEIDAADLPDDLRRFLLDAAERHVVFRYDRIAEFYAHAPAAVQRLMEDSALVVVDFDRAIERGFVRLNEDIDALFHEDHPDA